MPELPEVETVMQGLRPALEGGVVERLQFNRKDLRFPLPPEMPALLAGQRIEALQRRGKYILGFAGSGNGFVLHLGMSGVMRVIAAGQDYVAQKHDHVVFEMLGGVRVVFNDARRFGFLVSTHRDRWEEAAPFKAMGPEPLGNGFSGEVLYAALSGKATSIKAALLDQRVVAGLGNIYVCEALHYAGILPQRIAGDLSVEECALLAVSICTVLREAIAAGGSSLRDYRNTQGKMGYFQHHFAVYDRAGKACPDCDCDIGESGGVQKIVQSGRSSYYCARRQV